MKHAVQSIRAFMGAKDYQRSRSFYQALGFEEVLLSHNMCYFRVNDRLGFYLQDAYVKDWVDNTMIFLEVSDVEAHRSDVLALNLTTQFSEVRI